jgi:EpsI family protein
MTTKRLALLLAVLILGMGSVYVLPRQLGYQPVGIVLELPEFMGEWWGHEADIQQKEREVLGHDTEFARKTYSSGRGDSVLASIVLAGQDMMTGIHRPERCLIAQGWEIGNQSKRVIDVPVIGRLETTRLHNVKHFRDADGRSVPVDSVCYYWFVGHTDRVATHGERVWLDMRDRVLKGYNQRWGMVMISAEIKKNREKFGRDEQQTDALLAEFIKLLAPILQKERVERG